MSKRMLDLVGATLGLTLLSPLLLLAAILIKVNSPGPVFFVQERLGKDLKPFRMYKFRTMVMNAEQMGEGLFSYSNDQRVTKIGKYLRQFSIDELPQLLNVLGGSMALVGPRPPVTYELGPLDKYTEFMKVRFRVKPGITGLAQISGRNDLAWEEKMIFDNKYVTEFARLGPWLDLKILFQTCVVVLSMRGVVEQPRNSGP